MLIININQSKIDFQSSKDACSNNDHAFEFFTAALFSNLHINSLRYSIKSLLF